MILPAKILYYKLELSGYLIDHNCVFPVVSQKDTLLYMLTVNGSVYGMHSSSMMSVWTLFSTNDGNLLLSLHSGLQKIVRLVVADNNCGLITEISL